MAAIVGRIVGPAVWEETLLSYKKKHTITETKDPMVV